MSLPPPQTQEFVDRLTSLAVECREELSRSSQALQEINLLMRQTQQEIDRLGQRETQQASRVREMESSLESYSRTEIRDTYVTTHDVQLRLFMMRSQIEQLESRRESIENQQEKLRILLDLAEINREQSEEDHESDDRTRILPGTRTLDHSTDVVPQLIDAKEEERARIARLLTDGAAQVLTNAVLRTQILERVLERQPESANEELQDLEKLLSDSLVDIRRAIYEMRPLVIDEIGLVGALRRYTTDFARENGASITVEGEEEEGDLDRYGRIMLFRIVQGAVVAMIQPNAGGKIHVSIENEEAQLTVRLDGSELGPVASSRVGHFVEDEYVHENLELIGASIQRESFSTGERLSIILPLET
ncbi:MAG: histidine kinase [Chloroflexota bacterium]